MITLRTSSSPLSSLKSNTRGNALDTASVAARDKFVRGRSHPAVPDVTTFKIADTLAERTNAFALVYENYLRAGLIEANPDRMRVTHFHLHHATSVFIALLGEEVVATLTLVGDSHLGIPMELVYPDEIRRMRDAKVRFAEVSSLAVAADNRRESMEMFFGLNRLMGQHARMYGYQELLIAAHPVHARFYCSRMGFQRMGRVRPHPSVRNHPATACHLKFDRADLDPTTYYQRVFESPLPKAVLQRRPLQQEERMILSQAVQSQQQAMMDTWDQWEPAAETVG